MLILNPCHLCSKNKNADDADLTDGHLALLTPG